MKIAQAESYLMPAFHPGSWIARFGKALNPIRKPFPDTVTRALFPARALAATPRSFQVAKSSVGLVITIRLAPIRNELTIPDPKVNVSPNATR